jgi:hypothetical protein
VNVTVQLPELSVVADESTVPQPLLDVALK